MSSDQIGPPDLNRHGLALNPQQIILVDGGGTENSSDEIRLAVPGMPGHETVLGVWRTRVYGKDEAPTVEAVTASLVEKYGQPQAEIDVTALQARPANSMREFVRDDPFDQGG